ncbi:MAG: putative deacylase [Sphingobacteriales bacterium]|jgi:predicted deacylase
MSKPLEILGRCILPGKREVLELEIAKQHTRNSLTITVVVDRAVKEGPVVLFLAGVHGDELNGVAIVRDLIRQKTAKPKKGTIIYIPVLNVFGYMNISREFPDGRDLNRMFPGSAKGSLASQFAHAFTKEIAPVVDVVLDFHTGGADRENSPNIRCVFQDKKEMELAIAFGSKFIVHSNTNPKTIRHQLKKMGKTCLLFEGGKSKSLDTRVIEIGVKGALNVLQHLGMKLKEEQEPNTPIYITKNKWLRAPHSGMFQPAISNGVFVSAKQDLGVIMDPFGEFKKRILSPSEGYIYGLNTGPIVHKGDALFHISTETQK